MKVLMKKTKKSWSKPQLKIVKVCCECTAYVSAS
jgi:hypothetical protein